MKVIAVFNVDDEKFKGLDYDDLRAKLEAPSYTISLIDANVRVRPLPQFMEEAIPYQVSEDVIDACQDPYATGWNDCLRKITGETE